jgi:hypothetical protein
MTWLLWLIVGILIGAVGMYVVLGIFIGFAMWRNS